jgi:hypothetical protein
MVLFMDVEMESFEAVEVFTVEVGVSFALSGDSCLLAAGETYVVRVLVT